MARAQPRPRLSHRIEWPGSVVSRRSIFGRSCLALQHLQTRRRPLVASVTQCHARRTLYLSCCWRPCTRFRSCAFFGGCYLLLSRPASAPSQSIGAQHNSRSMAALESSGASVASIFPVARVSSRANLQVPSERRFPFRFGGERTDRLASQLAQLVAAVAARGIPATMWKRKSHNGQRLRAWKRDNEVQ